MDELFYITNIFLYKPLCDTHLIVLRFHFIKPSILCLPIYMIYELS